MTAFGPHAGEMKDGSGHSPPGSDIISSLRLGQEVLEKPTGNEEACGGGMRGGRETLLLW